LVKPKEAKLLILIPDIPNCE